MQVQRINSTPQQKPAFQANLLSKVIRPATEKSEELLVDIYSINREDTVFLNRVLEVMVGNKFKTNKENILENKDVTETFKKVINKALDHNYIKRFRDFFSYEGNNFFLAVENNSRIAGVMELTQRDGAKINNLITWGENSQTTSKALLARGLKETYGNRMVNLRVNPASVEAEGVKLIESAGFKLSNEGIKNGEMQKVYKHPLLRTPILEFFKENSGLSFIENKSARHKQVDLNEIFPKG